MYRKPNILVVEDEVVIAHDLIFSLERLDYRVTGHAVSWDEAESLCKVTMPDIALMDIHIKGPVDGIESAKYLRERFGIPSIFLTAYSDENTLSRAKLAEPFGYLLKPFDDQSIRAAVEMAHYKFEMEMRLRQSEEWFSTTMECIGDGVIATNLMGKIIYMNAAAEELTGWKKMESLQRDVTDIFKVVECNTGKMHPNIVNLAIMKNMVIGLANTAMLCKKTGARIPINDSAAPIHNRKGEITGAVLIFRDETLVQEAFQQRERVQRLESLGLLAGGIAHDFNNLLAIIQGHAENLSIDVQAQPNGRNALMAISNATQRARELTRRFISFSKGQSEQSELIDVGLLLHEGAALSFTGTAVKWSLSLSPKQFYVFGERNHLENCFSNLFINASQAMAQGGSMSVSADVLPWDKAQMEGCLIPDEVQDRTSYLKLSFTDTGCGISEENLSRIFDPYFTTKADGHGLGLAIAHSFIVRLGGQMKAHSKIGGGTTFTMLLPLSNAPVEDVKTILLNQATIQTAGSGHILYIDDEELLLDIVKTVMERLGYDVDCANSGPQGIELYQAALKNGLPFDLVLTDCNMPGSIGGKEVIQQLRLLDPTVKVIVISGYDEEVTNRFSGIHINGFIAKPFHINKVTTTISEILGKCA